MHVSRLAKAKLEQEEAGKERSGAGRQGVPQVVITVYDNGREMLKSYKSKSKSKSRHDRQRERGAGAASLFVHGAFLRWWKFAATLRAVSPSSYSIIP